MLFSLSISAFAIKDIDITPGYEDEFIDNSTYTVDESELVHTPYNPLPEDIIAISLLIMGTPSMSPVIPFTDSKRLLLLDQYRKMQLLQPIIEILAKSIPPSLGVLHIPIMG